MISRVEYVGCCYQIIPLSVLLLSVSVKLWTSVILLYYFIEMILVSQFLPLLIHVSLLQLHLMSRSHIKCLDHMMFNIFLSLHVTVCDNLYNVSFIVKCYDHVYH